MEITVANKKTHRGGGHYVGRPSPLGNPFSVKEHGREKAIQLYKQWLWKKIQGGDKHVLSAMQLIWRTAQRRPVTLLCWCAPEACHADVIKSALEAPELQELWRSQ